jgi:hypothetical protein
MPGVRRTLAVSIALLAMLTIMLAPLASVEAAGGHRGGFHGGHGGHFHGGHHGGCCFSRFSAFGFFPFVPFYYPAPVYSYTYVAPPVYSAPAYTAPVVYSAPAPAYTPQVQTYANVQREVVYPNGKYVLYGDGVTQPWQWVWVPR